MHAGVGLHAPGTLADPRPLQLAVKEYHPIRYKGHHHVPAAVLAVSGAVLCRFVVLLSLHPWAARLETAPLELATPSLCLRPKTQLSFCSRG